MANAQSPTSARKPFFVRFYDKDMLAKDSRRRSLHDILRFTDGELEYHHDYIQILFPLPEGSPFNPSAPIIDRATFDTFRSRRDLQVQVRRSFIRMIRFYGFEVDENSRNLIKGSNWDKASKNWVMRFNHNHLRITRIIRSLRVLGLETEAENFYLALAEVHEHTGRISETSLMYWTRAVKRPLYLAPDDEEDRGNGVDFLYEFEEGREGDKSGTFDDEEIESEDVMDENKQVAEHKETTEGHDTTEEAKTQRT